MLKNLKELNMVSTRNWKAYLRREEKIEKQIKELTKKKSRLRSNSGLRKLFESFAEIIKDKLNAEYIECCKEEEIKDG